MKKFIPLVIFFVIVLLFFKSFFVSHLLPIPSDTLVGLYYPFRDAYAKDYPRGIPFKNFLITDPIRQQYPWRNLAIQAEKRLQLPLWNPYSFSGTPLLANFQSGAFYPLNLLFFALPFSTAWSMLIILQPLLGGIFLYLYLRKMHIDHLASLLGVIAFSFSGFSIAWMEWGILVQTIIWLPAILVVKEYLLERFSFKWIILFLIAECSAILAGHLQVLFYLMCVSNLYLIVRILQITKKNNDLWSWFVGFIRKYFPFLLLGLVVFILTSIQWIPTFAFINLSARNADQANWQIAGWFVPWQNLVQFIIPDFFGNPATLNYWGVWNYGEFIGYIGIIPLIFSLYAIFFRYDKKTWFFGSLMLLSLVFMLPTPIAKLPFILSIPFIATSQPTRLVAIVDFSLSLLAAFGLDYFLHDKKKRKHITILLVSFIVVFAGLWVITAKLGDNSLIAKHNMLFQVAIFAISIVVFIISVLEKFSGKLMKYGVIFIFIIITGIDLFRFGQKFLPFTTQSYLYPQTNALKFLEQHAGNYRIMTTDSRILPPNVSIIYHLQSIDGYDPLFIKKYAEFIAALSRGKPNIQPPFGYNRIVTPHNYQSPLINLLGVKYILSLDDLSSSSLTKVFEEGQTKVYENKNVLPRTFFVRSIRHAISVQDAINILMDKKFDLSQSAVVQDYKSSLEFNVGSAVITNYSDNSVTIQTDNKGNGFLVLSDIYYPTWKVYIDGVETRIIPSDYTFKGVFVPPGRHLISFIDQIM